MSTAPKHSMDIPHVAAIEFPLIVNDTNRATTMVGGKSKISQAISCENHEESPLELKLRPNDPFHHPIQSSFSSNEKILIKVSIPKKSLPQDYQSRSVRELIALNEQKRETGPHQVTPVAIIDKTFSFKAIADFQINTKNNKQVQEYREFLNATNYAQINDFFQKNDGLVNKKDYIEKEEEYFKNIDHQFPPPAVLSAIRFPFDYKYQKNPYTTAVKDLESGEIKVVSTKNSVKLYTIIIDIHSEVPNEPHAKLQESLHSIQNTPLYSCITWLRNLFDARPIWLRKQLEDLIADEPELAKHLKQAIPYVSYLYKSGPWRFCNIKYGVNPMSSPSYWVYQSEYFRFPGFKFERKSRERKLLPTLQNKSLSISKHLLFDGVSLPGTVTFQVGDFLDRDILAIIDKAQKSGEFLREKVDLRDGWVNKQHMQVIRRIVRYKLNRIANEEPIEHDKIEKIVSTSYFDAKEEEEEEDVDEDEDVIGNSSEEEMEVDEQDILNRLERLGNMAGCRVGEMVGYIKQDNL